MCRKPLALLLAAGIAMSVVGSVRAQDPTPEDLKARVERLERQNQELLNYLQQMQVTPTSPTAVGQQPIVTAPNVLQVPAPGQDEVKKLVNDALKEQEAKRKADEAAAKKKADDEGYKVGDPNQLTFKTSWNDGFVFSTPNKDFTGHIGGWIQWDNVFWNQSSLLQVAPDGRPGAKQKVASGANLGGIGDLEDGTYFRRLRIMMDGTFWENYEYTLIYAFENDQFNMVGLDEFWVGAKDLPWLGTVRFGHVKTPMGFEADMTASSRTMTFMERSSYSEAIELNQNFVTGIWIGNNYLDQRTTSTFAAFRSDPGSSTGEFFGDGQWGLQGRLTALPIWENEGRCWMHTGISGGWRNGSNNIAISPFHTTQLRARPELRDDTPPGGFQNGNANRMIDTGLAVINNEWLMGFEFCQVIGPFSIQAEYGFNWLEDVEGFTPAGLKLNPVLKSPTNYFFSGGYVQLAYTLTGEHRSYDKRLGRLDSYYFGRSGPINNAWFVRDENGCCNYNIGAWEIAARYSYVNLNDGSGLNTVQGGVMNGLTFGLNWYLNTNLKFQFDYVYDQRSDLPAGSFPGQTSGLGMRMQFMY